MTEKERAEVFLSAFKELENEVLSIARIKDEGHVSFSRALNDIYYQIKFSHTAVLCKLTSDQ